MEAYGLRLRITSRNAAVFRRYKSNGNGRSIPVASIYTQGEHPIRSSQIDKDALWAIRKIQQAGGEAYIVGGALRDILLGRIPKDFDIATSLSPRQVQRLFWNARIIGRRFRIVHLFFGQKIIEVTTFRSDEENFEDGRNNVFGTIEQDAKRRDFSINSLYYNPANGQLLDFNNALPDFRRRVIRSLIPLSYSFSEDPVRMIRALKYQATTGFRLRSDVRRAIRKNAANIQQCSTSRLTEEVSKILSSGAALPILRNLEKYGLVEYILPQVSVYLGYEAVQRAIAELDSAVQAGKDSGNPLQKEEIIYRFLKPMVVFPDPSSMSSEELFKEGFRQAKILLSPMTPPNYELERAVEMIMQDLGLRRQRKSAEARIRRKKPNAMMGRKRAAEEELSTAASVRKRRHRQPKKSPAESLPQTMAEEHDL